MTVHILGSSTGGGGSGGGGVPAGGTTGQVLDKNSSTDFDLGWANVAPLSNATPQPLGTPSPGTDTAAARDDHVHSAAIAGIPQVQLPLNLYTPLGGSQSSATTFTLNTEYCIPFYLPGAGQLSSLSIRLLSGGDTGSVIRMGVRQDNAGLPSATVVAQGTAVATGTGYITPISGATIPYGGSTSGLLWVSIAWQGGTSSSPAPYYMLPAGSFLAGAIAAAQNSLGLAAGNTVFVAVQSAAGAFPATAPATDGAQKFSGNLPFVVVFRSA